MRIVLDTNVLLVSASRTSSFFDIFRAYLSGHYQLCVSDEILYEYQEVLTRHMGSEFAEAILATILNSENTLLVQNYFHWEIITIDPDDNKFVDCAITANADFITTNDRHFDILKTIEFPKVAVITALDFLHILENKS